MGSRYCDVVDDSFGPWAGSCRGGFDFTLFFEGTMLSILPLAFMLSIIPLRAWYLLKRTTKVERGVLLTAKLVGACESAQRSWS